jgi:hypothetical protein
MTTKVPHAVEQYFLATNYSDTNHLLALFEPDAEVSDDGKTYHGLDELRRWSSEHHHGIRSVIREVTQSSAESVSLVADISGDFPGSPLTFAFDFHSADRFQKIDRVKIGLHETDAAVLPVAVDAYIKACNEHDAAAILRPFAVDALVNDQHREFWGIKEITRWSDREIVGDKVAMAVTRVVQHYDTTVVTAEVTGEYDKTGLPDPLALTYYFTVHADKITSLIILNNRPAGTASVHPS